GNDLERATKLARRMVCNWGMSERVGPVTFGRTEDHIFLGREMAQTKDYSEATAELIDQEVRRFIETAEEIARGILTAHIDKLHALSHRLLEKEAVDSREVDEIIGRAPSAAAEVESPTPTPER
ncbi:MAG TPA: cell division protein FtsH, partial [candidate division Zixibacteria bacterium]|nr:cell division protein FtsH [candidate division Zixibacteria bacterium]